ncbi:phage tail length tape measure family protein [Stenotrophomonas maltophilia]|nr:phage tail length tape measure family protein [Stenotrophomonas maltophilia]
MATSAPNLRVRISADINDIKQGLALVRSEVAAFKKEAAKSIDLKGITDGFGQLRSLVGGLFAGVTVGSLFGALISETRDASNELAQLQAVLASTGQQAGFSQQQLLEMADSMAAATTHSAGEIVKAQTRLLSYTGIVGKQFPQALQMAIDQSARLGENIEQSAETIGKALDKPSQGVTALTKQGFKFTEQQKQQMKVMEATGRTAEAQQIVLDAMAESYAGAAAAARGTFGGALTAVGNSLRDLLDGSGSSGLGSVTSAINDVAAALRSPEIRASFADLSDSLLRAVGAFAKFVAQDGVRYLQLLAGAAGMVARNIDTLAVALGAYLAGQAVAAAIAGISSLIGGLSKLRIALIGTAAAANGTKAALATLGGPITLGIAALSAALYFLYQRTNQAREAAELHRQALDENRKMAELSAEAARKDAAEKRKQAQETLNAARAVLEERRARLMDTSSIYARGGDRGDGAAMAAATNYSRAQAEVAAAQEKLENWSKQLEEMTKRVADEAVTAVAEPSEAAGTALARSNANLLDAVRRSLAEIDRLYQDNGISIADYFAKRTALQQRAVDLELEQARSERALATEAGARRRIEEQIVKLQRDRAEVATVAAQEQKKAEEALSQSLATVKTRLLELDGKTGAAERMQLEAEYKTLLERLRAEGDKTGDAMVRSLIDRLVAKSKTDELRDAMGRITSQLQGRETAIGAQVSGRIMGYGEGEEQLARARAKALADLQALRIASVEAMAGYAKGSPEQLAALSGLQEIDTQIGQITASQQVWRQKLEDTAASAFGDFLADLTTGAKSFRESFSDMVKSFVAGVARMVAQEAALRGISALFSSWGPGASGATQVGSTVVAGKRHTGGRVGTGGPRISLPISPLALGAAPRFHTGGQHGLRADERLTVLQTGERVLSRRQTAAYDAAMRGGSGGAGRGDVNVYIDGVKSERGDAQAEWDGSGNVDISVGLRDLMRSQIRGGAFDGDFRERYGLSYRGRRGG